MFHYTVETTKSLDDAIQSLEQELKNEKFGVLWDFNVKETLSNKGFELDNAYRILEVCNPEEAQKVLSKNPLVSYFLPCKIVVYEDGDTNKIGLPRPTALIEQVNEPELNDTAKDIEDRMIACVDKAK